MHRFFLLKALEIAETYQGFCAPNPAVGAVLVSNGEIIASGVHRGCGTWHAERDLLLGVDQNDISDEMILYVTLEPCAHQGRTPPCTEIIIEKKIKRVIYAHADSNPTVLGGGACRLNAAGIHCEQVIVPEIEAFYRSYDFWLQHHRPYVTAKMALSADHKMAGKNGEPVALTGDAAQRFTHQQRLKQDAILTTANTVLADNSQLNVRLDGRVIGKPIYLLDANLRVPLSAKIFQTASKVIIFYSEKNRTESSLSSSIEYVPVPLSSSKKYLDWLSIFNEMGAQGMHSLWVEAGGECFESLFFSGFLNRAFIYQSQKVLGPEAMRAFKGVDTLEQVFLSAKEKVVWQQLPDVITELLFESN